ncbi:HNH endonuclease signature motif containing protein [Pseudoclavibacter terrae]|uniref:HNH endonuclease signature motif containing protein n=1 Tax=Pseudoclavibacter terrae TaxID=1530195 RepID=UPI00232D547E|nr:HNH endonuclease signature motif containing protein [Pseudoclavibacter terrae]
MFENMVGWSWILGEVEMWDGTQNLRDDEASCPGTLREPGTEHRAGDVSFPAGVAASVREAAVDATPAVEAFIDGRRPIASLLDTEFFAAFEELAARKRMLDATLLEMTAELLGRDEVTPVAFSGSLVRRGGFRSVHEAVQQTLGLRRGEAGALRELAEATRETISMTGEPLQPTRGHVAVAVAEGRVTLSQASAIARGLREADGRADVSALDRAEYELVRAACGLTPEDDEPASPERLAKQAAVWLAFLDPDGAEPNEERQAEKRGLSFTRRSDGMVQGRLLATPEQGEILQRVLDAYLSPRRDHGCDEEDAGHDATLRASGAVGAPDASGVLGVCDASGVLGVCDASGVPGTSGVHEPEVPIRDERSPSQRRIDALVSVLAQHAESPAAPRTGGEAPTLVVSVTRTGLLGAIDSLADVPRFEHSGEPAPIDVARRILCDGIIRAALVDDDGEVLKLGRKRRLFSPAQRRAIFARDGGCRAPGCEFPYDMVEFHHVRPWWQGGLTDTRNGIALCRFHHHEVHLERLVIVPSTDRAWNVEPATGPRTSRSQIRARDSAARAVEFSTPVPGLVTGLVAGAAAQELPTGGLRD